MNRTVRRKLIFFSALAAALVLAAVFSRQLCPYDPSCQNYDAVLEAPSRAHPFGTDQFGRDMLSRVLAGAATSIFSALVLVGIISVAGTAIGVICGYSGKAVDGILMRISDICLAFPGLVFALAIAAVLNGGIGNAVLGPGGCQLAEICEDCQEPDIVCKKLGLYCFRPACGQPSAADYFPGIFCRISRGRFLLRQCWISAQ